MPAASGVIVEPLTEQTLAVVETKATGSPELAVAVSATGAERTGIPLGAANVMVWGPCAIMKL